MIAFFWKGVKEMLLQIGFLEKMKFTWANKEVQSCSKPFSFPIIRINRFNPFDSIPLATWVLKFHAIRKGKLCKICCISLQEFCKVILLWSLEISKRMIANGTESSGLNLFSIKGISETIFFWVNNIFISETRFRAPLYYLKKLSFLQ